MRGPSSSRRCRASIIIWPRWEKLPAERYLLALSLDAPQMFAAPRRLYYESLLRRRSAHTHTHTISIRGPSVELSTSDRLERPLSNAVLVERDEDKVSSGFGSFHRGCDDGGGPLVRGGKSYFTSGRCDDEDTLQ